MIASVNIKGFQSHVNSQFNLSPGLTVLTGPTDSGKTAIIRAIRWVVFNEPAGEGFINQTTGEAIVQITLSDGTLITKGRKKGARTVYHLVPAVGKSQIFEQADVPPEVTAVLGITRQNFGDFEAALNFAFQLDAPFLISEPPSAGAKVLGKIAGTEIVDQAIKSVSKDTYGARQDKLQADKQIEQKTEELKVYEGVDQLKEQVDACDMLLEKFEQLRSNYGILTLLNSQKGSLEQKMTALTTELQQYVVLPTAEKRLRETEASVQLLQQLIELNQKHSQFITTISRCEKEISLFVGLEQAAGQLDTLDRLLAKTDILLDYEDRYAQQLEALKKADTVLLATKDLNVAAVDLVNAEQSVILLDKLKLHSKQYLDYSAAINDRNKLLASMGDFNQAEPLLAKMDDQRNRFERLKELHAFYRIKNDTFEDAGKKVTATATAVVAQEKIIQDLWAEVNVCPLCEQPILKGDQHGH